MFALTLYEEEVRRRRIRNRLRSAVRRKSEKKKNKKEIAFRCKTIMLMRSSISTLYSSVTEYTTLLYFQL